MSSRDNGDELCDRVHSEDRRIAPALAQDARQSPCNALLHEPWELLACIVHRHLCSRNHSLTVVNLFNTKAR